MQRVKGRRFEQWVADAYRKKWPKATVRRSLQAHQAYEPDVVIEPCTSPAGTSKIWTECQDAAKPNCYEKMKQAQRDIQKAANAGRLYEACIPVVVWHKLRERQVWATLHLGDYQYLTGDMDEVMALAGASKCDLTIITIDFQEFLDALPNE